jgi:hypothetical protein
MEFDTAELPPVGIVQVAAVLTPLTLTVNTSEVPAVGLGPKHSKWVNVRVVGAICSTLASAPWTSSEGPENMVALAATLPPELPMM